MLAELERLQTGQGFLCYFPHQGGFVSVAVLIQDSVTPKGAQDAAMAQLNDHFVRVNGAHANPKKTAQAPVLCSLSVDKNIAMVADATLNGFSPKTLFTCDGWDAYAALCQSLGINRADHVRLAKQGFRFKDRVSSSDRGQSYPASSAKELLKGLKTGNIGFSDYDAVFPDHIQKQRWAFFEESLNYARKSVERGYMPIHHGDDYVSPQEFPEDFGAWEYHLPYERCLFEFQTFNEEQGFAMTYFVLAEVINPETWEVRTMSFSKSERNNRFVMHAFGSTWDPEDIVDGWELYLWIPHLPDHMLGQVDRSGPKVQAVEEGQAFDFIRKERKLILPQIALINDMGTRLIKHRTLAGRHGSGRAKRAGEFYMVHPQDIDRFTHRQTPQAQIEARRSDFERSTIMGIQEVMAHKRRRPHSPPTAKKTVKIQSYNRGQAAGGTKTRAGFFVKPTPHS